MTTFTASNGTVITQYSESLEVVMRKSQHWLEPWVVKALREYFRHKEDERLGRWRWPENPDYVVYGTDTRRMRVLRESVAKTLDYVNNGEWSSVPSDYEAAARAFVDAHPVPKPAWHDAKPGEVWAVSRDDNGHLMNAWVLESGAFMFDDESFIFADDIASGHRIWPTEDAS